jgi:hypothetical protein
MAHGLLKAPKKITIVVELEHEGEDKTITYEFVDIRSATAESKTHREPIQYGDPDYDPTKSYLQQYRETGYSYTLSLEVERHD